MSLESKIQEALINAMKEKNQGAMRTLRAVKSAISIIKTNKNFKGEITKEQELALVQKLTKQRKESLDIFIKQNRADLAEIEKEEIEIIEQFLPAQLSESEVSEIINNVIKETGALSIKDMGKVMALANKKLVGRADGQLIAKIVKSQLV